MLEQNGLLHSTRVFMLTAPTPYENCGKFTIRTVHCGTIGFLNSLFWTVNHKHNRVESFIFVSAVILITIFTTVTEIQRTVIP